MVFFRVFIVILVLLSIFANTLNAEENGSFDLKMLKNLLGMSVYLQTGYVYNLEKSSENDLRIFDYKSGRFMLDLAQVSFIKEPDSSKLGFKLKVSAGETAKLIHATGLGKPYNYIDLTEVYVGYIFSVGRGLRVDIGKMVTYFGAEVIEAKDNPNYSRSFLFNYAIPFTQTGLKVSYSISDNLNATFHVVNGWDNFTDNNKIKTFGISSSYTPAPEISMNLNLIRGAEKQDNTSDNRFVLDWVGTIKPIKDLSLIVNMDYATEEKSAINNGTARWYGISGIIKYDFNDVYSLSVRSEIFMDKDGVRTGAKQTLKEITLTPEVRIWKDFIVRLEYRYDWSDKYSFNVGNSNTQDTVTFATMYQW